jgi:RNA polymerase sigma-70 factor (ECF subfamily)
MYIEGGGRVIDSKIEKYGKRLYGLCLSLCRNPDHAQDLYQETWLRVIQKLDQYDNRLEFEGWLTRICVNLYRDQLRKRKRNRIFDGFSTREEKDALLESIPAKEKVDNRDLHQAVGRLPDKLRITVLLYYSRDLDIHSTAAALGVPPGTVKSRLHKAKKLLKEVMQDEIEF